MNTIVHTSTNPSPGRPDAGLMKEEFFAALNRMAINSQRFFNVSEASEFLRVSEKTINRYKDAGLLPYIGLGDRVIFQRGDLIALMNKFKTAKPGSPKQEPACSSSRTKKTTRRSHAHRGVHAGLSN